MDGVELHPHVEDGCTFGHLLQLPLLLQVSGLGDDRDGLEGNAQLAKRPVSQTLATRRHFGAYLEFIKHQRFADQDQLLHLPHLSHLCVALVNHLETKWRPVRGQIPGGGRLAAGGGVERERP